MQNDIRRTKLNKIIIIIIYFTSIGELVKYNQNGILFDTHEDLFDAILVNNYIIILNYLYKNVF